MKTNFSYALLKQIFSVLISPWTMFRECSFFRISFRSFVAAGRLSLVCLQNYKQNSMHSKPTMMSKPIFFSTFGPIFSWERTLNIIYSFKTSPNTSAKVALLKRVHLIATESLRIEALNTVAKLPPNRVCIWWVELRSSEKSTDTND